MVLGNIKLPPPLNFTLHSIGKINKGFREYETPAPVKLYFTLNWEDQQGF